MERIKNKFGELNFKIYLQDLNDLPSDRLIGERYFGRKTLQDSFLYEKKDIELDSVAQNREEFLSNMEKWSSYDE